MPALGEAPAGRRLADTSAGNASDRCSSLPDRDSVAATRLQGNSGPGDTIRPISSATRPK